jgi:hypothetical protein
LEKVKFSTFHQNPLKWAQKGVWSEAGGVSWEVGKFFEKVSFSRSKICFRPKMFQEGMISKTCSFIWYTPYIGVFGVLSAKNKHLCQNSNIHVFRGFVPNQ